MFCILEYHTQKGCFAVPLPRLGAEKTARALATTVRTKILGCCMRLLIIV
jgi:hypothetical protein